MWIKANGEVSENVVLIATPLACQYLILGEAVVLADTGPLVSGEVLANSIEEYLGVGARVDLVLLTHADFDHIGGLYAVKKRWPNLKVICGKNSAQLLQSEDHLKLAYEKNVKLCAGIAEVEIPEYEDWKSIFTPDRVVGDGDDMNIGGEVEIKLISSPGHTTDSVSYYVKPDQALICSESAGQYRGRDLVSPCFNASYSEYLNTISKFASLEVQLLGLPHSGVITGTLVTKYLSQLIAESQSFFAQVKDRLNQGELVEEIASSILPEWKSQNVCPEGPFAEEQAATLVAMVRAVATHKDNV